jgi:hypothetical protein
MRMSGHRRLRVPSIAALIVFLATMALSLPSYRLIPGWNREVAGWPFTWGLDLFNVYAFHTCAGRNHPYLWTGLQCGDPLGRAMPYPPLLYWGFAWLRALSFPVARAVWAVVLAAVFVAAALTWAALASARGRARTVAFGLALCVQFPAVFAIERGNNDAVVVAIWTLAAVLFVRGRSAAAGAAAAAAAAAKLYPLFACAIVVAGGARDVLRRKPIDPALLRWGAGFALAAVLDALLFWTDSVQYAEHVLPTFAAHLPAASLHSHSVPATFGSYAPAVSGAVLAAWGFASARRLRECPVDVLAGALAVSTFVARVSFDYNLVTAYPLLVVQAARCFSDRTARLAPGSVLALGVLGVVAHRGWFGAHAVVHVGLQVAWLLASAMLVAASRVAARSDSAQCGTGSSPQNRGCPCFVRARDTSAGGTTRAEHHIMQRRWIRMSPSGLLGAFAVVVCACGGSTSEPSGHDPSEAGSAAGSASGSSGSGTGSAGTAGSTGSAAGSSGTASGTAGATGAASGSSGSSGTGTGSTAGTSGATAGSTAGTSGATAGSTAGTSGATAGSTTGVAGNSGATAGALSGDTAPACISMPAPKITCPDGSMVVGTYTLVNGECIDPTFVCPNMPVQTCSQGAACTSPTTCFESNPSTECNVSCNCGSGTFSCYNACAGDEVDASLDAR